MVLEEEPLENQELPVNKELKEQFPEEDEEVPPLLPAEVILLSMFEYIEMEMEKTETKIVQRPFSAIADSPRRKKY